MIKIKKCIVGLALFLSVFPIVCTSVFADSSTTNTFSVSPLNPETNEPQSTYYNLRLVPNQQKEIKLRIFNSSDKDKQVNVALNNASTNNNGVVSYAGDEKKDSTLKVPFTSFAKLKDSTVTIPKKGSYDVAIAITMPAKKYSGAILGGVRVTSASNDASNSKSNAAVKANIAYSVAILVTESDDVIDPSMHLIDVKKENRNYRNFISAQLQNSASRLIKKLEVNSKVYKEHSNKLLYQASNSQMQMAPNSNFNFGISLENTAIKPGKYTMKISGKADGKPFSFQKDFKISESEAKLLNKNAVYAQDDSSNLSWVYIVLLLVLVLLTLGLIFYLVKYKKIKRK